jgi:hypothetical protein
VLVGLAALAAPGAWRGSPVVIDHISYTIGKSVGRTLTDSGIRPTIALGRIGMVGYYGRLPLIDLHGLTDRTVSRTSSGKRGHIGLVTFQGPMLLLLGDARSFAWPPDSPRRPDPRRRRPHRPHPPPPGRGRRPP